MALKEGFQLFFVLSFNVVSMTSRLTDGPVPVSRLLPCPHICHLLARSGPELGALFISFQKKKGQGDRKGLFIFSEIC